jgi:transcription termination factor Rho
MDGFSHDGDKDEMRRRSARALRDFDKRHPAADEFDGRNADRVIEMKRMGQSGGSRDGGRDGGSRDGGSRDSGRDGGSRDSGRDGGRDGGRDTGGRDTTRDTARNGIGGSRDNASNGSRPSRRKEDAGIPPGMGVPPGMPDRQAGNEGQALGGRPGNIPKPLI